MTTKTPKKMTVTIAGKALAVRRHGGAKSTTLVIHDDAGIPFAAVVRSRERTGHRCWLVSCSQQADGIHYMAGMREADEVALGVAGSYRQGVELAQQIADAFYPPQAKPLPCAA